MSFKDYDKKTYIADLANDFAARRISKRSFLKKAGLAGVGFSAFNVGLLSNTRRDRGFNLSPEAMAQDAEMEKWLKDVSAPFKGTKIRYTSEATPPTVVLDKLKGEFTAATGIYTMIAGDFTLDTTNISHFGLGNALDLGGGKFGYFQEGSFDVVIIPEPGAALLGGLGVIALLRRRRR